MSVTSNKENAPQNAQNYETTRAKAKQCDIKYLFLKVLIVYINHCLLAGELGGAMQAVLPLRQMTSHHLKGRTHALS
jgi:hypothetical protein